ncbi:hypothetical protein RPHASCH2410_CH11865 [Rhizobium phaseoli Ch24-10]|nr:hypothetical protein RPHASCH2410_CH11865 [Rhizobium phaseoli Ch24-10]
MITEMPIPLDKADCPSRLMEGLSGFGCMAHPDDVITLRLCYNDCGEIEAGGPAFVSQGDRLWIRGSKALEDGVLGKSDWQEARRRGYCVTVGGFATELTALSVVLGLTRGPRLASVGIGAWIPGSEAWDDGDWGAFLPNSLSAHAPHPPAGTFSPHAGRREHAATSPFPTSLSQGTSPRPVYGERVRVRGSLPTAIYRKLKAIPASPQHPRPWPGQGFPRRSRLSRRHLPPASNSAWSAGRGRRRRGRLRGRRPW